MTDRITRRDLIKRGAALASYGMVAGLTWPRMGLAQDEVVIAWTDVPANFNPSPATGARSLDTRALTRSAFITPVNDFYQVQHYTQPAIDASAYRLNVTGLIKKPMQLTLDELKKRPRMEQVVGWECGGSSPASFNRLTGNARFVGTSLSGLLKDVGLQPNAKEVVFFGVDKGMESVTHGRAQNQMVEQHFGRSLIPEDAMRPEVMLAWEMNGEPLVLQHGAPVRLVVPGWYGVSNVKWLNHIHVQDTRFIGRFMARDYVTFTPQEIAGETIWSETLVSRIRVKSMVARLTRRGTRYAASGYALSGWAPLKTVEVKIDNGPWQKATMDSVNTKYSWQFFTYEWDGLTAGEHTIVSRATDADGTVQPEQAVVDKKQTQWENNGQFVRKFTI